MKTPCLLALLVASSIWAFAACADAQSLAGRWDVAYTLDGASRLLRLDAGAVGTGSFLLRDPRSSLVEPAEPSKAEWRDAGPGQVVFSGPVEFPIGNVGRESGTLVFKGRFSTADLVVGNVAFFPPGQDPSDPGAAPSKTGSFKATRVVSTVPVLWPRR